MCNGDFGEVCTLVGGLACDLLLARGKPRGAPAGMGCGRGAGRGASAGRHGTTIGPRGPWTMRPLPASRQREASALPARSALLGGGGGADAAADPTPSWESSDAQKERGSAMVTALLVGLLLGWVLAIPPGPIAIAMLRQALAGQARAGVAIALGAAAMDSVSAGLAGWASSALVASLQSTMRAHAWGLLAVQARGWVGNDAGAHVVYAMGFGTGSALWFVLLLRTVTPLRARLSPQVLPRLLRVAGGAMLLCAGLLTYHLVTAIPWGHLSGWSWQHVGW
jgi:threonine/homoserine/homoserine lactone efflux protein